MYLNHEWFHLTLGLVLVLAYFVAQLVLLPGVLLRMKGFKLTFVNVLQQVLAIDRPCAVNVRHQHL